MLDTYGLRHSEIILARTHDSLQIIAWLIREDVAFEADYVKDNKPGRNLETLRELYAERWQAMTTLQTMKKSNDGGEKRAEKLKGSRPKQKTLTLGEPNAPDPTSFP